MKHDSPLLVATMVGTLLLLLSVIPDTMQGSSPPCRFALCAEPRTDPVTGCQNDCEGSTCMFSGCVNLGNYDNLGPTWRPTPCITCQCSGQTPVCFATSCFVPQCFGHPMVKRPWTCCPQCDFNISATECGVVPLSTFQVKTPAAGGCRQTVLNLGCDKSFVVEGEDWYRCEPVRENVTLSPKELSSQPGQAGVGGCGSTVTYERVTRCNKRRLSPQEIPRGYDPNPDRCNLIVEDGVIVTTMGAATTTAMTTTETTTTETTTTETTTTETTTTQTTTTETVTTTTEPQRTVVTGLVSKEMGNMTTNITTTNITTTNITTTTDTEGVTGFIGSDAPPIATPLAVVSLIACAILLFCPGGF